MAALPLRSRSELDRSLGVFQYTWYDAAEILKIGPIVHPVCDATPSASLPFLLHKAWSASVNIYSALPKLSCWRLHADVEKITHN